MIIAWNEMTLVSTLGGSSFIALPPYPFFDVEFNGSVLLLFIYVLDTPFLVA